jgi:hypothetical protein
MFGFAPIEMLSCFVDCFEIPATEITLYPKYIGNNALGRKCNITFDFDTCCLHNVFLLDFCAYTI